MTAMTLRVRHKIARRLAAACSKFFRRDFLTGAPLVKRDDLLRLGSARGGWVVPRRLLHSSSVIYCAGCGEDITFDLALIDHFGCEVHAFDPTPRAIEHVKRVAADNPRYRFFPLALSLRTEILRLYAPKNPNHASYSALNLQQTSTFIEVESRRLGELLSERKHTRIDLLKIDIEGAEYQVLTSIVEDNLMVGTLCVEFDEWHHPLDASYAERIRHSISTLLEAGYSIVCIDDVSNYTFVHGSVANLR